MAQLTCGTRIKLTECSVLSTSAVRLSQILVHWLFKWDWELAHSTVAHILNDGLDGDVFRTFIRDMLTIYYAVIQRVRIVFFPYDRTHWQKMLCHWKFLWIFLERLISLPVYFSESSYSVFTFFSFLLTCSFLLRSDSSSRLNSTTPVRKHKMF